ncbi:MAG: hypothetical protein EBQ92_01500, partial [Proteobacteria bacterium]|nr:hypothetical protein [Pseudomonadota bacterium]
MPPLPEQEVLTCLESAWKYKETDLTFTDLGNCFRFVAQHGQDVRYVRSLRSWLLWNGCIWQPDETGEIHRRAKQTVKSIWQEVAHATDDKRAGLIRRHAEKSESAGQISAMLKLVKSEYQIAHILAAQLDVNP